MNSFKIKLREVNVDIVLTIVERLYCYVYLSFFVFLYCIVLYLCFSSMLVACWALCYLF